MCHSHIQEEVKLHTFAPSYTGPCIAQIAFRNQICPSIAMKHFPQYVVKQGEGLIHTTQAE